VARELLNSGQTLKTLKTAKGGKRNRQFGLKEFYEKAIKNVEHMK
jgi:hypothetical protein